MYLPSLIIGISLIDSVSTIPLKSLLKKRNLVMLKRKKQRVRYQVMLGFEECQYKNLYKIT